MPTALFRLAVAATLALSLGGCAGELFSWLPGAKPAATETFKTKLGSLEFKSVSDETSKKLDLLNSTFGTSSNSKSQSGTRDAVAPATADSAGGSADGGSGESSGTASDAAISSGLSVYRRGVAPVSAAQVHGHANQDLNAGKSSVTGSLPGNGASPKRAASAASCIWEVAP